MKFLTCFFPLFNRAGLGRKPLPEAFRLARQVRHLDALCLNHLEALLGHGLPLWLRHFKQSAGANSRKRTFTPVLTFWTFLSQVLDPGGSCRRALSRVQALCALKGHATISDSTEKTKKHARHYVAPVCHKALTYNTSSRLLRFGPRRVMARAAEGAVAMPGSPILAVQFQPSAAQPQA